MSDLVGSFATAVGDLGPLKLVLIFLTVLAGGIVKGAVGFGFPLVTSPLLSSIWDPRHAVLLLSLANLFNNVGVAARGGGSRQTLRRLAPTIVGLIVGVVVGALLLASLDAGTLSLMVGSAALIFAIVAMLKPDLAVPPRLERYLALPMGLLGGILGGSTSISGPGVVSYLLALQLTKREFVFFLSLLYLVGGIAQVVSYTQLGLYDVATLTIWLATCIPNLVGVWLGLWIQDWIDPKLFRRVVVVVIGLTASSLIVRGLWR